MFTNSISRYYSEYSNGSTLLAGKQQGTHSHTEVDSPLGKKIIPGHQHSTIFRSTNTQNYSPNGVIGALLGGSGTLDFTLKLNTLTSHAYDFYFIIEAQMAAQATELTPVPLWFDTITFLLGSQPLCVYHTEDIWAYNWLWSDSQWDSVSQLMGFYPDHYPLREIVPANTVRQYILRLPGNWMNQSRLFGPGIDCNLQVKFVFNPAADILISGLTPTINQFNLEIVSNHALESDISKTMSLYKSNRMCPKYYWLVRQSQPFTGVQANQEINFELGSFTGLFAHFQFYVIVQNAQGLNRLYDLPIGEFDILDENGFSVINNSNRIREAENRLWTETIVSKFDSFSKNHHNVFMYPFSLNPGTDYNNGTSSGFYYFGGKHRLLFNTGRAAVSKVITLTGANAPPVAGSYRLIYHSNTGSYATDYIAFNSAAAVIQTAINGLLPFRKYSQTVAVSNALSGAANITITYAQPGQLQYSDEDRDAIIIVEPRADLVNGGPAFTSYNSSISTRPVEGFPNNTNISVICQGRQLNEINVSNLGDVHITRV